MFSEYQDALISSCGRYRYMLLRRWDRGLPLALFLMKNPSTADAAEDDATIRKCRGFAGRLGFGGFYVGNLYAYRSTDPKAIPDGNDGIGNPENDGAILEMLRDAGLVIVAWGDLSKPQALRAQVVLALCPPVAVRALRLTRAGHPHHPARLPYSDALVELPADYPLSAYSFAGSRSK